MELTDFSFEKPLLRKRKKRDYSVTIMLLLLALIAALLVDMFWLTPSRLAGTAHAAEVIYQNDHYCELVRTGEKQVVGAEGSIEELCAEWGVDIAA